MKALIGTMIAMLIVGGLGSIVGALIGTALIQLAREGVTTLGPHLIQWLPGIGQDFLFASMNVLLGALIVFFLIVEPRGLARHDRDFAFAGRDEKVRGDGAVLDEGDGAIECGPIRHPAAVRIGRARIDEVDALIEGAIRGMLKVLDPHSAYLNSEELRILDSDTQGQFGGVGDDALRGGDAVGEVDDGD